MLGNHQNAKISNKVDLEDFKLKNGPHRNQSKAMRNFPFEIAARAEGKPKSAIQQEPQTANAPNNKIHRDSKKAIKFIVGILLVALVTIYIALLSGISSGSNKQKLFLDNYSVGLLADLRKNDAVSLSPSLAPPAPTHVVNYDMDYLYSYENDLTSLFHHDLLPSSMRDDILSSSKIKKVSVIVAHCDHDLNWMADFIGTTIKPTLIVKVLIFTKCNRTIVGAPPGAEVIALPNVGRCDHTYAHWLSYYTAAKMFSSDDEDEIVLFTKDTGSEGTNFNGRTFGDLLSLTILNGFSCMMMAEIPSWIHDYSLLRGYNWQYEEPYSRKGGDTIANDSLSFKSEYSNLGEWVNKISLTVNLTQNIVPVCYGGMFAATMTQIRKQPKWVWENIEQSMSRGDNIEEGHFAERFWAALLSKPMSNKTATVIWESIPHIQKDWSFAGMITQQTH